MKEVLKLKVFWIVVIVATAVIFVALLNFNRGYKSETDVLVIPKNSVAVENSDQILENLKFISFGENSEINPALSCNKLNSAGKNYFGKCGIKTSRINKSGIVKIITFNADQIKAEDLNNQAVKTFIATASHYYNIKTDIDIRIVSGPMTKKSTSNSAYILFIVSLAGTFILASLAFFASFSIFRKRELGIKNYPKIIFKSREETIKPLKKSLERKKEFLLSFNKKAVAPDNLPIAQDLNISQGKTKSIIQEATPEEVKERLHQLQNGKPIIKEATPEEVKERLNQLLSENFNFTPTPKIVPNIQDDFFL